MEDNTLKRTMKLHHLVIFGVAFLTPMIAYTIYGVIATASHGVESGSICFAVIAMMFTALSYGHMAKAFPAAGSTYTYTRKAINSKLGVIAGWIVLLGYVFFPMAIWLIGASYFSAAVPAVPSWVWLVGFIVVTTLINIVGVEVGSKINFIMVSIQVVIIIAFLIFTIKAITEGMGEGTLASFSPFYNPDISFGYTVAGAAAACYCFLGFDALTTFTEDTVNPTKNIPRAIILTLLVCGAIFLIVTYFTHLVHPSYDYSNPDNAAYEIARQVAPSVFGGIFLIGTIAGQFAAGLSAQASGARLLYAMGRDGVLPEEVLRKAEQQNTHSDKLHSPDRSGSTVRYIPGCYKGYGVHQTSADSSAFFFVNLSVIAYYFVKTETALAERNYTLPRIPCHWCPALPLPPYPSRQTGYNTWLRMDSGRHHLSPCPDKRLEGRTS